MTTLTRRRAGPTRDAVAAVLLLAGGALAAPGSVPAQEGPVSVTADTLEARVDALMSDYVAGEDPGAVVGVIRGGELVFAGAYGTADLASGTPITTGTRFNLGSASKQFTGFALALLEQRGKLSLDDPVSEHLPDWPTFEETVTLRHLLTHSSGYREAYGTLGLAGWTGDDRLSREQVLEVVRRQPELEFPPGTSFSYNSTAYVILAEVAERATGRSFPEWMRENVFGPLGMQNTVIESEVGEVIPGAAHSYADGEEGGYRLEFSNRAIYGAAEVYTTVGDFAKWLGNYGTPELGGPAVLERTRQPLVLAPGDTTEYALGLFVGNLRGRRQIWHGGSHAGYQAFFSYAPGLDTGVLVMSNYAEFELGRVAFTVSDLVLGGPPQTDEQEVADEFEGVAVDSATLERYAGHYRTADGEIRTFERRGAALDMAGGPGLVALSDTLFRLHGQSTRVAFHAAVDGSVAGATLHTSDGERVRLRRIEPWTPGPEELERYAGRYVSPELETIYDLAVRDGRLVAEHRWHGTIELTPRVRQGVFRGTFLGIRFERNEAGRVTGFRASAGRTDGVWFRKLDQERD